MVQCSDSVFAVESSKRRPPSFLVRRRTSSLQRQNEGNGAAALLEATASIKPTNELLSAERTPKTAVILSSREGSASPSQGETSTLPSRGRAAPSDERGSVAPSVAVSKDTAEGTKVPLSRKLKRDLQTQRKIISPSAALNSAESRGPSPGTSFFDVKLSSRCPDATPPRRSSLPCPPLSPAKSFTQFRVRPETKRAAFGKVFFDPCRCTDIVVTERNAANNLPVNWSQRLSIQPESVLRKLETKRRTQFPVASRSQRSSLKRIPTGIRPPTSQSFSSSSPPSSSSKQSTDRGDTFIQPLATTTTTTSPPWIPLLALKIATDIPLDRRTTLLDGVQSDDNLSGLRRHGDHRSTKNSTTSEDEITSAADRLHSYVEDVERNQKRFSNTPHPLLRTVRFLSYLAEVEFQVDSDGHLQSSNSTKRSSEEHLTSSSSTQRNASLTLPRKPSKTALWERTAAHTTRARSLTPVQRTQRQCLSDRGHLLLRRGRLANEENSGVLRYSTTTSSFAASLKRNSILSTRAKLSSRSEQHLRSVRSAKVREFFEKLFGTSKAELPLREFFSSDLSSTASRRYESLGQTSNLTNSEKRLKEKKIVGFDEDHLETHRQQAGRWKKSGGSSLSSGNFHHLCVAQPINSLHQSYRYAFGGFDTGAAATNHLNKRRRLARIGSRPTRRLSAATCEAAQEPEEKEGWSGPQEVAEEQRAEPNCKLQQRSYSGGDASGPGRSRRKHFGSGLMRNWATSITPLLIPESKRQTRRLQRRRHTLQVDPTGDGGISFSDDLPSVETSARVLHFRNGLVGGTCALLQNSFSDTSTSRPFRSASADLESMISRNLGRAETDFLSADSGESSCPTHFTSNFNTDSENVSRSLVSASPSASTEILKQPGASEMLPKQKKVEVPGEEPTQPKGNDNISKGSRSVSALPPPLTEKLKGSAIVTRSVYFRTQSGKTLHNTSDSCFFNAEPSNGQQTGDEEDELPGARKRRHFLSFKSQSTNSSPEVTQAKRSRAKAFRSLFERRTASDLSTPLLKKRHRWNRGRTAVSMTSDGEVNTVPERKQRLSSAEASAEPFRKSVFESSQLSPADRSASEDTNGFSKASAVRMKRNLRHQRRRERRAQKADAPAMTDRPCNDTLSSNSVEKKVRKKAFIRLLSLRPSRQANLTTTAEIRPLCEVIMEGVPLAAERAFYLELPTDRPSLLSTGAHSLSPADKGAPETEVLEGQSGFKFVRQVKEHLQKSLRRPRLKSSGSDVEVNSHQQRPKTVQKKAEMPQSAHCSNESPSAVLKELAKLPFWPPFQSAASFLSDSDLRNAERTAAALLGERIMRRFSKGLQARCFITGNGFDEGLHNSRRLKVIFRRRCGGLCFQYKSQTWPVALAQVKILTNSSSIFRSLVMSNDSSTLATSTPQNLSQSKHRLDLPNEQALFAQSSNAAETKRAAHRRFSLPASLRKFGLFSGGHFAYRKRSSLPADFASDRFLLLEATYSPYQRRTTRFSRNSNENDYSDSLFASPHENKKTHHVSSLNTFPSIEQTSFARGISSSSDIRSFGFIFDRARDLTAFVDLVLLLQSYAGLPLATWVSDSSSDTGKSQPVSFTLAGATSTAAATRNADRHSSSPSSPMLWHGSPFNRRTQQRQRPPDVSEILRAAAGATLDVPSCSPELPSEVTVRDGSVALSPQQSETKFSNQNGDLTRAFTFHTHSRLFLHSVQSGGNRPATLSQNQNCKTLAETSSPRRRTLPKTHPSRFKSLLNRWLIPLQKRSSHTTTDTTTLFYNLKISTTV